MCGTHFLLGVGKGGHDVGEQWRMNYITLWQGEREDKVSGPAISTRPEKEGTPAEDER